MRHPVLSSVQVPPVPSSPASGKDPALLTSPFPFLLPPGPTAGSTVPSRNCRQLQRTPPASSAWSLWRTQRPTAPWCARSANTPGSTGAASRWEPFPRPRGTAGLSSTRASLTPLVFLLQGQAMGAGIYCFQCPLCRDKDRFVPEMFSLGIRVPLRSVSFCLAHRTGGCKPCHGGTAPAVLALCCPVGRGFSLMEELETGQGEKKSRDVLHLPYTGPAGAHPFYFLHQNAIVGEQQCICRPR